jgi:zinc protease
MKRTLILTGLALLAALVCLAATTAPAEPSIQKKQLVLLPDAQDPVIDFRLLWKVGSQDDPKGKEGLANLTAELMAGGATRNNSYEQIIQKLYPLAADYSVQVDKEVTVIAGRVHRDNLAAYYPLLLDAVLHPTFDAKDFERVRQEVLSGIERNLRYANEEELGKAALYEFIYQGTPYQHLTEGYVSSLQALTVEDVKNFYREHFRADNLLVGLGGGYAEAFPDQVRRDLSALPTGQAPAAVAVKPAPVHGLEVLIVEKPTTSTAISLGYPLPVLRNQADFYPLWLADSWLGTHRNSASHLYQVIREARGLNYGDYAYIEYFPQGGRRDFPPPNVVRHSQMFEIWIRPVEAAYGHFAVRAAVRELKKLVDDGMSEDAFALTQKFLLKYYRHYAPTAMARLGYAMDDVLYGVPGRYLEILPKEIAGLDRAKVNQAVKRNLEAADLKIVFVTQDAEGLKKALTEDTPSPVTYRTPKPQSVLDEDKQIEVFPLKVDPAKIHIVKASDMFEKPLSELPQR